MWLKPKTHTQTLTKQETFEHPSFLQDEWRPFGSCSRFVTSVSIFSQSLALIWLLPCGSFRGRSSSLDRCRTWPSGSHRARLCCRRTQFYWRLSRRTRRRDVTHWRIFVASVQNILTCRQTELKPNFLERNKHADQEDSFPSDVKFFYSVVLLKILWKFI